MQGHVQVAHGHRRNNQGSREGSREAGRFLSIKRVKWPPVPVENTWALLNNPLGGQGN